MTTITEAEVEQATLDWLSGLGWAVAHGPDIAPDTPNAERDDYGQVVLERRLRDALAELNPGLSAEALGDAVRKLTRPPCRRQRAKRFGLIWTKASAHQGCRPSFSSWAWQRQGSTSGVDLQQPGRPVLGPRNTMSAPECMPQQLGLR